MSDPELVNNWQPISYKSFEGVESEPFLVSIRPEHISEFHQVVGWPQLGSIHPQFLTSLREGEFQLLDRMKIHLSKVLHAEQEYSFSEPSLDLKLFEKIQNTDGYFHFSSKLTDVKEKLSQARAMAFLTFETQIQVAFGANSEEHLPGSWKSRAIIVVIQTPPNGPEVSAG